MAGVRPFFITGANAKVVLNNKTLAFCTDLAYSVQVITKTPKILGAYEGSSVEPLGYSVSGSFTVIRYAKDAQANVGGNAPNGVAANDAAYLGPTVVDQRAESGLVRARAASGRLGADGDPGRRHQRRGQDHEHREAGLDAEEPDEQKGDGLRQRHAVFKIPLHQSRRQRGRTLARKRATWRSVVRLKARPLPLRTGEWFFQSNR